jgi:hypothetical protein
MSVRLGETAAVLVLMLVLLALKRVEALAGLPLSQITGIVAFSFAIFLALGLYQQELARIREE